jgi:hypothetical protein
LNLIEREREREREKQKKRTLGLLAMVKKREPSNLFTLVTRGKAQCLFSNITHKVKLLV